MKRQGREHEDNSWMDFEDVLSGVYNIRSVVGPAVKNFRIKTRYIIGAIDD